MSCYFSVGLQVWGRKVEWFRCVVRAVHRVKSSTAGSPSSPFFSSILASSDDDVARLLCSRKVLQASGSRVTSYLANGIGAFL
jgi:hypothetical protein